MKVSKVVLIVIALHVLVIGGIFIFEGCSRAKGPAPEMAENESPADQAAANLPALPAAPVDASAQNLTPAQPVTPTSAQAAPAATTTYVVKKGDSLWKVAKNQSVSIGELCRANNLTKTSTLKIGQKLQIPAIVRADTDKMASASVIPTSSDVTGSAVPAPAATTGDGRIYMVRSGDSLWKIARQQNVSVATLKQANNLTSDSLNIGQKLHIPAAAASAAIASAAGTSAAANAAPVSAGVATTSYTDWHEPGTYYENGQTIHVVGFDESPSLIAKKYGIKTADLMKVNNITDATRIWVGQKLIIPTAPGQAQPVAAPAAAPAPAPAAATTATASPIASANSAQLGN